jgi:hypothetical protein
MLILLLQIVAIPILLRAAARCGRTLNDAVHLSGSTAEVALGSREMIERNFVRSLASAARQHASKSQRNNTNLLMFERFLKECIFAKETK